MRTLEIVFWISLFIVFYTYIGYGIVLYILVKIKETFRKPIHYPIPPDEELPELTLFIAAYNEEDVVDEKMQNCLDLDYPTEKLQIFWVTDGSNDHTNERLSRHRTPSAPTAGKNRCPQPGNEVCKNATRHIH